MGAWSRLREAVGRTARRGLVSAAMPMIRAAYYAGYEGASQGRRMGTLRAATIGPNTAVAGSGQVLRNRARDLVANNAWAGNAEESFVANFVGTGIVPRWNLPNQPELKREIQRVWKLWTDEADAAGALDFYGLQELVGRTYFTGGECLIRKRLRLPEDDLIVPLQLQVLESDHLDSGDAPEQYGGNVVRMGIEFDRVGRRVAYHLSREHPGDLSAMSGAGGGGTVRVPAREICHVYNLGRPGQLRGVSRLANIIVRLHMLDSYEDATLERNRMSAMFLGFIRKITSSPEVGTKPPDGSTKDKLGNSIVELQPGILAELGIDEDVTWSQPPGTEATFEAWIKHELRACAAGAGLTFEQLTGNYEGGNYSRTRAALLEFRRRCEMLQHHIMVYQFCRPVMLAWMDAAVLAGVFPIPVEVYRERRREFTDVIWIPPKWQWLDPIKDAKGEVILIDNLLKSRSASIAEQGEDAEEVDETIAEDNARAERLGIRKGAAEGADGADDDTAEEDDKERAA